MVGVDVDVDVEELLIVVLEVIGVVKDDLIIKVVLKVVRVKKVSKLKVWLVNLIVFVYNYFK